MGGRGQQEVGRGAAFPQPHARCAVTLRDQQSWETTCISNDVSQGAEGRSRGKLAQIGALGDKQGSDILSLSGDKRRERRSRIEAKEASKYKKRTWLRRAWRTILQGGEVNVEVNVKESVWRGVDVGEVSRAMLGVRLFGCEFERGKERSSIQAMMTQMQGPGPAALDGCRSRERPKLTGMVEPRDQR